eukprot:1160883-Pelagomonas_calceolata.AAC.14
MATVGLRQPEAWQECVRHGVSSACPTGKGLPVLQYFRVLAALGLSGDDAVFDFGWGSRRSSLTAVSGQDHQLQHLCSCPPHFAGQGMVLKNASYLASG